MFNTRSTLIWDHITFRAQVPLITAFDTNLNVPSSQLMALAISKTHNCAGGHLKPPSTAIHGLATLSGSQAVGPMSLQTSRDLDPIWTTPTLPVTLITCMRTARTAFTAIPLRLRPMLYPNRVHSASYDSMSGWRRSVTELCWCFWNMAKTNWKKSGQNLGSKVMAGCYPKHLSAAGMAFK